MALPVRMVTGLPARGSPIKNIQSGIVATLPDFSPMTVTTRLVRSTRGWRWLCPRCGRGAATIYFPLASESHEPGCRVCLELVYDSQYEMSADAAWDRFVRAMDDN